MPQITEKKSEQVLVNVAPATFETLSVIAETEDRPLGYVARELMIRGLALYRQDGRLRDVESPPINPNRRKAVPVAKEKAR